MQEFKPKVQQQYSSKINLLFSFILLYYYNKNEALTTSLSMTGSTVIRMQTWVLNRVPCSLISRRTVS